MIFWDPIYRSSKNRLKIDITRLTYGSSYTCFFYGTAVIPLLLAFCGLKCNKIHTVLSMKPTKSLSSFVHIEYEQLRYGIGAVAFGTVLVFLFNQIQLQTELFARLLQSVEIVASYVKSVHQVYSCSTLWSHIKFRWKTFFIF